MSSEKGNGTDLLQCPYDMAHEILRSRFQVHLARCRRNHLYTPKIICPFNVTHILNKPELDWHVGCCPDRRSFEEYKYRDPRGELSRINESICSSSITQIGNLAEIESVENWDNEPTVPSYNPTEYSAKSNVLRAPVGMAPAQRTAFRKSERERLSTLKY